MKTSEQSERSLHVSPQNTDVSILAKATLTRRKVAGIKLFTLFFISIKPVSSAAYQPNLTVAQPFVNNNNNEQPTKPGRLGLRRGNQCVAAGAAVGVLSRTEPTGPQSRLSQSMTRVYRVEGKLTRWCCFNLFLCFISTHKVSSAQAVFHLASPNLRAFSCPHARCFIHALWLPTQRDLWSHLPVEVSWEALTCMFPPLFLLPPLFNPLVQHSSIFPLLLILLSIVSGAFSPPDPLSEASSTAL